MYGQQESDLSSGPFRPSVGMYETAKMQTAHSDCKASDPRAIGNAGLRGETTMVEYSPALLDPVTDVADIARRRR